MLVDVEVVQPQVEQGRGALVGGLLALVEEGEAEAGGPRGGAVGADVALAGVVDQAVVAEQAAGQEGLAGVAQHLAGDDAVGDAAGVVQGLGEGLVDVGERVDAAGEDARERQVGAGRRARTRG